MKNIVVQNGVRFFILTAVLGLFLCGCAVEKVQYVYVEKTPSSGGSGGSGNHVSAGWNLGNQLDCFVNGTSDGKITTVYKNGIAVSIDSLSGEEVAAAYETLWGMPAIRSELIQSVKAQGFDTIRLPVTWSPHLDGEGKIDEAWMNRVEQVVDMILDEGLECVLNVHHDTNHLKYIAADFDNIEVYKSRLSGLWVQIATRFKDKSNRLMFEGFNEILNLHVNENGSIGNWDPQWNDSDGSYSAVNQLNQAFVNTVRGTGGKNSTRILICNAYATNITDGNLGNFVLPSDSVEDRLIVQYHNYNHDYDSIHQKFQKLKTTYTDNGIKVIVGECGIMGTEQTDEVTRYVYGQWISDEAYKCGIKLFWWDDGNTNYTYDTIGTHALFSRRVSGTEEQPDYSRYGYCYFPELCRILTSR